MPGRKNPTSRRQAKTENLLRMNELVKATGVPKSTILHYVREGLLPEPVKTSPNMAYYDPASVARLRLIRHLQKKHRLPLSRIKAALDEDRSGGEADRDMAAMLRLGEVIFGSDTGDLFDLDEFCRESGLSPEEVRNLEEQGLIIPLQPERYDMDDLSAARSYSQGQKVGLSSGDAEFYVRLARKIVDYEMELRRRITHDLPLAEDALITTEMTKTARIIRNYIIERTFQTRVMAFKTLKEEDPKDE
jgi:DNA-binding transcriptional MerR regulator